jgi:cytidylate kinase
MAIIVEGPDASGKSTLCRTLANEFNMTHIVSGGAPPDHKSVLDYCRFQLKHCSERQTLIDRVTPISHQIYNPEYEGNSELAEFLNQMVTNNEYTILVYCRPPIEALMRPEKHEWKDYDTEDHKQKILLNQMQYIGKYDEFFSKQPHISYDYTMDNDGDINIHLISMLAASVYDNHVLAELRGLMKNDSKR